MPLSFHTLTPVSRFLNENKFLIRFRLFSNIAINNLFRVLTSGASIKFKNKIVGKIQIKKKETMKQTLRTVTKKLQSKQASTRACKLLKY